MDYAIWSVILQGVYETRVHDIDELRQRLLHVWCSLEQSLIDDAVLQLTNAQRRCVLAFVPEAGILNILYSYQFVSLYMMNFKFHTMFDAAGDVLGALFIRV